MQFLLKNYLLILLGFLLACQSPTNDETPSGTEPGFTHNTLSETEKEAGWELLFDGKSTGKWRGYNKSAFPKKGWKVIDKTLVVKKSGSEESGYGGDIITKEKFENFELMIDFLLTDTANSGIFYMVNEVEDTPIWHNAPEYQILDDAIYATMGVTNIHFTGANYDLHPAENDFKNNMGQWNTARIIVNNGHVEHWLNGNKVVAYDLWTPEWEALVKASKFSEYPDYGKTKNGHIGIQDHGQEVRFRNIKIRRL